MKSITTATLATLALALPAIASGPGGGHNSGPGNAGPGKGGPIHGGPGNGGPGHGGPGNGGPGNGGPGHGGPATPNKKPLVSSKALQADITLNGLREGAKKLQKIADSNGGTRVFGSSGHNTTVDWIYNTLKATGDYNVYKQPFTEQYSEGDSTLTVNGKLVDSLIMTYTPAGTVEGANVVPVPDLGCTPDVYPAGVVGNIALVSRGTCTFADKVKSAKTAGAAAIVIYNNIEGSVSGTLGEVSSEFVPVAGITLAEAEAIISALATGPVTADFVVHSLIEDRVNYNVIAETKEGDHDNVLVVGAHSDSVKAGAGINDDGSGSIGILEVAKALPKYKIKNAVRFGWWGAEEFGKLGSYYYVRQINQSETELAKMRAYLNFDMIASPNYIYSAYDGDGSTFGLVGPAGSDVIEKDFQDYYKSRGYQTIPKAFDGRSDYAAFIEHGIPAGGIFTGAEEIKTAEEALLFGGQADVALDVNYHGVGDTIDNLAWDAFLLNAKSIANSVAKYALSWDSIPAANLDKRRYSGDMTRLMKLTRDDDPNAHAAHAHSGPCGGEEKVYA